MNTPLLVCERARIDLAGAPLVEQLSFATSGERVAVLGEPGAVFRLLSGQAELMAGSVEVSGLAPRRAIEHGLLGLALGDSELPAELRVREYLELGARLDGQRRAEARRAAHGLLEAWALLPLAERRCRELLPAEQRVLLLAQGLLGSPEVLAANQLFHGLEPSGQQFVAEQLARGLGPERRLLLGVEGHLPGPVERQVLSGLDEIVVIGRGTVLAQAAPDEIFGAAARYRVSVLFRASLLAERLTARGVVVTRRAGEAEPVRDLPEQLLIELPDGVPPEVVLEDSLQVGAVVLELIPLPSGVLGPTPTAQAP